MHAIDIFGCNDNGHGRKGLVKCPYAESIHGGDGAGASIHGHIPKVRYSKPSKLTIVRKRLTNLDRKHASDIQGRGSLDIILGKS